MALTVNLGDGDETSGVAVADPEEQTPAEPTQERIELFSINGRSYSIPKRPGPNVALRYLRDVRRHGREHALAGILEAMLGTEGMDALADYDDLTDEDMDAVMAAVERHVLGPLEKKTGKR